MKARRFLTLFSLIIISSTGSFAQPGWFGGTPAVVPHVYSGDFKYGITQAGKVYVILMNSNYAGPVTSADVKNFAIAGPLAGRISTWNLTVAAGNINTVFTVNAINQIGGNIPLIFNSDYTFYFVAETSGGVIQAAPTRIYMKTLACPDIYFLNALQQTIKCVNYGASAVFNVSVDPNPEISGILKGTIWTINWGDGNIVNFTSAIDNDIPTLLMRTHTYVSITDCNYVFSCSVKSLCGKTFSPQYVAIVHGRDIPSDGDGVLQIVNNADGSTLINVCEGTQSVITVRDNSTWNCQNPTVPGGLTAVPNIEPRNIEWLYGRDPLGALTNTITGAVAIATLGNAPQASGRFSPVPYGPTSLSQAITIPATCKAGEYFRVYLKNWNKCNWTDPEYVNTFIDIHVVAAPPAPTAPDVTICTGGGRTLRVTSPAVGTLTWYSDAALTTVVGNGATYVPAQTVAGAYSFWVTDQYTTGLKCVSPATKVTLTIRETLATPGVITGPATSCPGIVGLVFSVPANPPVMPFGGATQYVWTVLAGLTISSGQGSRQITVDVGAVSGNQTISITLQYATAPNCGSGARSKTLSVYSIANVGGVINGSDICPGGTVSITSTTAASTGAPASAGPTYSWDRSPSPFTVWTALPGTLATFSEVMATSGIYRYRRTATFGCGPAVTATVDIDVFSTANVGGAVTGANICAGGTVNIANTTPASTGVPASAGPTYSWERSPSPFTTWTAVAGAGATFSEVMATPGTYRYRRTAAFGCSVNTTATTADIIVYSTTHNAGAIAGTDICPGGTVTITNTTPATTGAPASAGPAYSWDRSPSPFTVWTALPGAAATFSEVMGVSGIYRYRRTATFGCGAAVNTTVDVDVFSTTNNGGAIAVTNICAGGTVSVTGTTPATTGVPASAGPTYSWERSPSPFTVWTGLAGSAATYTETMATSGTYRYRRTASFGCGISVFAIANVIVYSTTHAAGAINGTNICAGATVNITNTTPASTGVPASAGPTYSWDRSPGPLFSTWTALPGAAATFSEIMATPGTYRYRRTATFACGIPVTTTKDIIVNPNPAPSISGLTDVCSGAAGVTYTTAITAGNSYAWTISGGAITAGAGTNTITVTWGAAGAGWVRVTETMAVTGCAITTSNYAVTINPGPPVSAPAFVSGATNICLNGTLNLDVTDVANSSSYIWDYSWVAGTNNATTATSQISINLTGMPIGTYTVSVRAANGCGSGPWMPAFSFNINDIPDLSPLTNTVCSDVASAITLAIANSGVYCSGITYNITAITSNGLVASAGAPATGNGLAANVIADDAWTNTTGNSVNVVYAIVPVSSQGCTGLQENVTLTVKPKPVITSGLTETICNGGTTNRAITTTNVPAIAGVTYTWTAPVMTGGISGGTARVLASGSPITDTFVNNTNGPQTATYTVTPFYNGCSGSTQTMVITVNPSAQVNNTPNVTYCNNATTVIIPFSTDRITGVTTYSWTNSNTSIGLGAGGAGSIPSFTATNAGTAPVSGTITVTPSFSYNGVSCTGPAKTFTITVNPSAQVNNVPGVTYCNNATTALIPLSTDRTVGTTTYSWTNSNIAIGLGAGAAGDVPSFTATNAGTAPISATITVTPSFTNNGVSCAGPAKTFTITVNPAAQVNNIASITYCNNATTVLIPFNTDRTVGATTYSWTNSNTAIGLGAGATGNVPSFTATNAGTAPISGTITVTPSFNYNGVSCTGPAKTFTITVNPSAQVNDPSNVTYCNNSTTVIIPFTTDRTVGATTYSWTNSNISIGLGAGGAGSVPSFTATNAGTAPISGTITVTPSFSYNGISCAGPAKTFTITVSPAAQVNNIANVTYCNNGTTTLIPFTTDRTVGATTYSWTNNNIALGLGAGATGDIPSFTAANGGTAPISGTITVTPSFSYNGVNCTGPAKTFTITVNPTAQVNNTANVTYCNNATTVLIPFSTDRTAGATTYSWTNSNTAIGLGAGATGSVPSFTATNAGTAPISGTITVTPSFSYNGVSCTGPAKTFTITVNPSAQVNNIANVTYCNTATTLLIPFSTDRTVGATTYSWTNSNIAIGLGAGAAGDVPSFTATNAGTAPISGTITVTPSFSNNGVSCTGASKTFTITVNPASQVNNIASVTYCNNAATAIIPFSTDRTVGTTTYSWTNSNTAIGTGAGAAGDLPSFTATNAGTAPISGTITVTPSFSYNGVSCTGPARTFTITVNPSAQVNVLSNQTICNGGTSVAVNFTTNKTGGTYAYSWTNNNPSIGLGASGNGNISSFTATNIGPLPAVATITVTPSYTNNLVTCTGPAETFTITVNPTPKLSTTLTPADVCSKTAFSYMPASLTPGTTFNWTRAAIAGITPAGPTSGINNPNETFVNITSAPITVIYQYTLAANGCSNIQNVAVNIKPEPVITAGQNPAICSGNALNYQILLNNFTNPGDNVIFTWAAPVLSPSGPSFSGGTARGVASSANITDSFHNTSGVTGSATYTVTPFKNGCAGTPVTVVVTIGSQPVLDPGLNMFACSNNQIGLILKKAAGSVDPAYYNIIGKTVDGTLTDVGNAVLPISTGTANALSADKYINTTGTDKTVTYHVQPILPPDCIGDIVDIVVTIRPQPVIFPAQMKTVCSGVPIGKEILLTPDNTPAGTLFNWPVPVISDASVQGTARVNVSADPSGTIHINDQIRNYSGGIITATYLVMPVSQFSCVGQPTPVVITINPEPIPKPISGRDKICITEPGVVYSVPAMGGSTFHWTVDPAVGTKTFDFNTNAIIIEAAAVAGSGNVTVYETNSYSCNGAVSTMPVEVLTKPAAENITGPASVCTNSTQTYSVTGRSGSSYSWTVPGGTAIVGDPSANTISVIFANVGGTISVHETNSAGCETNHIPKAITVNPLPTATISGGGTICQGSSRNLVVSFTGIGPYTFTYALDGVPQPPVSTAANPYALNVTAAGTYTIINVSDANCTNNGTGTTTITYFPKAVGIISGTAEMCKGISAVLTMTFTGTPPYSFTYSDGISPVTILGHPTNVYTVAVSPLVTSTYTLTSFTDGNNCPGDMSGSAVMTINLPPVLTLNGTNLTCYNVNTGTINMTIANGTAPFVISWTGPNGFTATTQNISTLESGYYAVVVNDSKGCSGSANITLSQFPVLTGSASGTNITCFGANDGTIAISGTSGGTGTFEFTVNGGSTWQPSNNFTGLAPGTYDVKMRDAVNPTCLLTLNSSLILTGPAILNATVIKTDVTCFGAADGSIVISSPTGGYGTYGYSINGGSTWQPSGSFTNLANGIYNVRIRDAANPLCVVTPGSAVTITQPDVLSATLANTLVSCYGSSDGTIIISSPSGGHGNYEYSINGGGSWQSSGSYTGLAPGTYNVQIRDKDYTGCFITLNGALKITQPAMLSAGVTSSNITCNGANDGVINITSPQGGYGTYEYSIVSGVWQSSGSFAGLSPGSYDVQIKDAAHTGCVGTLISGLTITEPVLISATVTFTDVTCNSANDGSISITGSTGGSGSYEYSINGGTTWSGLSSFTNLSPGVYNVQIRDAAHTGCVITLSSITITQPAALSAAISGTDVSCFGGSDGSITLSAPSGGYGTYEYSINGGGLWQTSGTFTTLIPGYYNILIRDAGHPGCIKVLNSSYVISQSVRLSATVTKTDVTCNGANDGKITITSPSGGYGIYEYSVDGGTSWNGSGNFINLVPATYDVHIRDAANITCSVILYPNLIITEPVLLALTSTGEIQLDCFGDTDGTGTFYGSGGTLPYSFHIISNSTGATIAAPAFNSQTFYNAGTGTITVAVSDMNGCLAQATINVTQPSLLTPGTVGPDQILCSGDNPAPIAETVPATGGPAAYNYQWQYSANAAGPFINIAGATLSVYTSGSDATNTQYFRRMITSGFCMPVYSNVVEIKVNQKPVAVLSGGETICPAQTSILKVNMMAGTGPFELNIENHGVVTGYVSGADIIVPPASTTVYTLLSVKDANGCTVTAPSPNLTGSATVTVRSMPVLTTSPVSKTSCESGMVTFSVAATGSDLTYQWFVDTGSGFNPVADGGVYFGATNSTLNLFGVTRLMDGYIYHAVVTGCSSSVTSADATLTVNTVPEIVTQPVDSLACMGAGAIFNVTATGTGNNYQWQVNKGSGFVNVVNDANFGGADSNTLTVSNIPGSFNNYILRVIVTGKCGIPVYSNIVSLRVIIPPVISLNPLNKSACDGTGPIIFSANGSGMIDSLRWQVFSKGVWSDVHDSSIYSGSSSQQLTLDSVHTALNGNLYRLALISRCVTVYTASALLTVNPNPVVNFSAVDPIHACGNVPIIIDGNPTGGSGVWSTHLWTGDMGPLNNYFVRAPAFTSRIAGTYVLNYKVKDSNGCFGTDDVNVIVDAPDALFTQDINEGCSPATVTFTKDMTGIAKFWWDFGDGSPKDSVNANPVHIFTNVNPSSIEYKNVKLKVQSAGGCTDTFTSLVTVYPDIDATFIPGTYIVCSGSSIIFTALPGAGKYFWDYGDGVSGYYTYTPTHLFINFSAVPVIHTVSLTTTSFYNCTDVKTIDITVMPVPLPQFTTVPVSQVYNPAGSPVTFTNATNPGTWTWLWKFGDGTTSAAQDPLHTYTTMNTFNVVLIVSNSNCSDSVSHEVMVLPIPPVANFDSIPSGCAPLNITLNNTSLNTEAPGTTYRWDFDDGSTSTARNPTYTYFEPGAYRVELIVTGPGGTSSKSQVINVYPSPKAYFEVSPQLVFVNDEKVRVFNLSEGADSYLWEFGDGDTSKVKEPFHRYMTEGVYDITLWAYSENGCSDKYVLSPGVTVEPTGILRFSNVFTPNKDGPIERTDLPTSGIELDQFFFPAVREKVINYKLQIFNRLGVLIFESHDINVPWNGYYKGTLCPQGVYVWYVEGKYANGIPFKQVGDVTLLH